MKKDIHPKYSTNTTAKCACGSSFTTGSTKDDIYVEICSACHPFYTGKQKLVDTARRVEKFQAKAQKSAAIKAVKKAKKSDDKNDDNKKTDDKGSLKDQLEKVTKKSDK